MSGSTIGGAVGAVIGFVVSGFNPAGAMWGWQIGSLVGAVVDPDVIEGPRLQESRTQTATDGVALTYGYGTFRCAGNVTWVDEVKEHRHEDDGKGGPTQVTYTYTISYMVTVCKGQISGYKLIRRNGKIVYDARTDAELTALGYTSQEIAETRAAQASFLQRATLYYGTDDQMPDPTMVAVLGAGNVPAYTGVAYIVMTDDETREGEYAQFEFVVANCGERSEDLASSYLLVTGMQASPGDAVFSKAKVSPGSPVEFVGIPQSSGADIDSMVAGYHAGEWVAATSTQIRYSSDLITWQSGSIFGSGSAPVKASLGNENGWLVATGSAFPTEIYWAAGGHDFEHVDWVASNPADQSALDSAMRVFLDSGTFHTSYSNWLFGTHNPGEWDTVFTSGGNDYPTIVGVSDVASYLGKKYAILKRGRSTAFRCIGVSSDGGITYPPEADVLTLGDAEGHAPDQLCVVKRGDEERLVAYCVGGGVWTDGNNWSEWIDLGIAGQNTGDGAVEWMQTGRKIAATEGLAWVIGDGLIDGDKVVSFDPWSLEVSEPHQLPIIRAQSITAANPESRGTPIPDAPGFYIDPRTGQISGPSGTQIDPCQPTLAEIVAAQCDKRGVDSRDVSELTDPVGGYRIAKPSSPLANIQGLQPAYFFGASEFDGKLHFPKRGRDLTFALTYDDMVEREGDLIQWERVQERDLLRKATAAYTDPATNYADTTQQAERRSATVKAEGESVMELPITGDKDWAAQVADKSIKVAWGEPDECTFHVSIAHAELVTGAEGTVPYTDGTPTVVRIERIDDEGLVRMVHARKTRRHLYESNASGAAKPLPRFPGSNVRGPTDGVLMNLPVLLDQDDRPGIHWAAAGMMSGWQGGQLQIRRAGQWTVAGTVYNPAGMGTLLDPLPAHAGDVDTANVLRVRFNEPLESVAWVNLLQERNPFAILRDDGTAEIIQAQTATATAPDEWELTTLLRRRLATETSDHAAGARIVFLDQRVQYATLEPTDVGTTLEYRFVSVGTDPDAVPIQTLELTTMESQREWPVADLSVEVDGDDYTLTWLRRDRLGTDVIPIRSANWAGYEVSYSWIGGSGSVVVETESHTFNLPGASDITFSVAQLNQYTGAGPAQTVTVP